MMNNTYRPNVIPAQVTEGNVLRSKSRGAEPGIQSVLQKPGSAFPAVRFRVEPGMTAHLRCVLTEMNKGESNG